MNKRKLKKEIIRREKIEKGEKELKFLKMISKNENIPESVRLESKIRLEKWGKEVGRSKKRNRCYVTGKGTGVIKRLGLYRMEINELIRRKEHPNYYPYTY